MEKRSDELSVGGWELFKKIGVVAGIIAVLFGVLFLSPNITSSTVIDLGNGTSNLIGIVLVILGVVGVYAYFKFR